MTDSGTIQETSRDEFDFGTAFSRSPETVTERFQRLRGPQQSLREGDRAALRDHLVMEHRWLVAQCARAFAGGDEPLEDLIQEGTIGLIKAVDRFDPDKGVRFTTYAGHLILGEMRHYLRDLGKMIHEPGWHAQLRVQVARAADSLTQKLGRAPELDEIASSMSIEPQTVARVLESQNLLSVASLDVESDENSDGATRSELRLLESDGAQPISTQVENHIALGEAIGQLRDLEQRAVSLFFYEDCSKTEIARRLGISVNYAAYLVKRGVEHLRLLIEPNENVKAPREKKVLVASAPIRWADASDWIARHRNDKTNAPFSLMLLQIRNWNEATSRLDAAQKTEAHMAAIELARRCCRKTDQTIEITDAPFDGPALLALMPKTAIEGRRAGERWLQRCNAQAIWPQNPDLLNTLGHEYSYATHPDDGSDVSQLLAFLLAG